MDIKINNHFDDLNRLLRLMNSIVSIKKAWTLHFIETTRRGKEGPGLSSRRWNSVTGVGFGCGRGATHIKVLDKK